MSKQALNPKLIGSNLIDCKPQKGLCPINCNQCFYNRASYVDPDELVMPSKKASEDKIVRMNALHDSNVKKYLVLKAAKKYEHVFFNTSLPKFNFPGPVVYTANNNEEQPVDMGFMRDDNAYKLMFVRLRVSPTNLIHIKQAIGIMNGYSARIPIVLTFMRYYDVHWIVGDRSEVHFSNGETILTHTWRKSVLHYCWCPTKQFKIAVLKLARVIAGYQVTMCGTAESNLCKDCKNCSSYYWITKRRIEEKKYGC